MLDLEADRECVHAAALQPTDVDGKTVAIGYPHVLGLNAAGIDDDAPDLTAPCHRMPVVGVDTGRRLTEVYLVGVLLDVLPILARLVQPRQVERLTRILQSRAGDDDRKDCNRRRDSMLGEAYSFAACGARTAPRPPSGGCITRDTLGPCPR